MDPNPKIFPILSYVMSRLHPTTLKPPDHDIEQPPPSEGSGDEVELVERMPHLTHPDLLASMARAVSDVASTRNVLRALGDRPDHEAVDVARARIAEIDSDLSLTLEQIILAELENDPRASLVEERRACRALIGLDEMHEEYKRLLKDAEDRLVKMYGSASEGGGPENESKEGGEEHVNEEVIGILQQASGMRLERVELSDRQLKFLPEEFGRMRNLVSLNVSNNLLEVIPDSVAGLEFLEELRASSNLLSALPDSIGLLLNLKILDVSGNQLKALPDSISNCRSLVELDASYNSLAYLPTNIGFGLMNLQKLQVHLNKLRSLPSSVCEMRSLRFLDAHFNELRGLPYAIGKLTNLETLNLSSNFSDLQELPVSIGNLTMLRELDLSNNQIHELPDTFGRLDKLVKLNLDQNPLIIPPPEIVEQGVEAVTDYMAKRWIEILLEEERKSQVGEEAPTPRAGWLTRSTSWLSDVVTGVSTSVVGYLGTGEKSENEPYLDQRL